MEVMDASVRPLEQQEQQGTTLERVLGRRDEPLSMDPPNIWHAMEVLMHSTYTNIYNGTLTNQRI